MIIVLLADGFEEIEALTPVDLLRREGVEVKTVGISSKTVTGSHGISVVADCEPSEIDLSKVKLAIFPGGMPGALNLDASPFTDEVIRAVVKNGGRLAAICAAPLVFGRRGLLDGKLATCFPGFEKELCGATVSTRAVVTDGMITTANGMTSAMKFAEELVRLMVPKKKKTEEPEEEPEAIEPINDPEASRIAEVILNTLESFNVRAKVRLNATGPRVYQFAIYPAKGVKVTAITRLFDDIQLSLGIEGMRMEAPIPGKSAIGFEVPRRSPSTVTLSDLLEENELAGKNNTTVPFGKAVLGDTVYQDITKLPHLIVSGATGMGKSVFMNSLIISLAKRNNPKELKMILIDPKKVEYSFYTTLPHLYCPVVTEIQKAVGAFKWAVEEMERRYEMLEKASARSLDSYNDKVESDPTLGEKLPRIVIFVDELSDLMVMARNDIECLIMSIAQKARAAGIHLILGTQRPSVDVLTGVVKANIPSRLSCKVSSYVDSKTVLEMSGAEKLLSNGDMLYLPAGAPKPIRVQGAFISDNEIVSTVSQLVMLHGEPALSDIPSVSASAESGEDDEENESILCDKLFREALEIAVKNAKVSTSLLQRKLSIGYSKAAMFIDYMVDLGIAGEPAGSKPREVLITKEELEDFLKKHI